jgi:hypothetical protein
MLPLDRVHPSGDHSTDAQALSAIELLIGFGIVLGTAAALWAIAQMAS